MSKITIREIREKYLTSKEKEKEFKWTYRVRRPASYYLAIPFLRLGVSATSVTVLWLIIASIGCALLASGVYLNMVIGAALLEFAVILDCVDGHIARCTRTTRLGDILDTWVGEFLLVSSIFSTGIGLSISSDSMIMERINLLGLDKIVFVYIGFFGALVALASWTIRLHWRTVAMKLALKGFEQDRFIRKSKAISIVDNIFHYSGALTMLLVVSAALRLLDIALILISLNYAVYMIAVMARIFSKAQQVDSAGNGQ